MHIALACTTPSRDRKHSIEMLEVWVTAQRVCNVVPARSVQIIEVESVASTHSNGLDTEIRLAEFG